MNEWFICFKRDVLFGDVEFLPSLIEIKMFEQMEVWFICFKNEVARL